ncbi:hypothetical protein ACJRPK_00790 [Aquimarina sp. 2-A2]|uniref:hypothetical protein n=1 Tax=Aquimarina sp. 2-A2 TaxID=3382644 RepID=UPI00387EF0A2
MVIINIYRLSIENNKKESQVLNRFNSETDFLEVIQDFCNYTLSDIYRYSDSKGRPRTFTLSRLPIVDLNKRYIAVNFEPGYTGDEFKVKDGVTNSLKYSASRMDLQSRELFSMFHIPKGSKYGYLCIQKKENFAVKTIVESTLNMFLKKAGYMDFNLKIENAPNYKYLNKMMTQGELKEIRLIRQKPLVFDDTVYLNALEKARINQEEHVARFNKHSNTSILKNELKKVFMEQYKEFDKISFLGNSEEYDEISFILTLDKITKTFHVKDKSKIRSNMDVSRLVDIVNGEVDLETLVKASFICINNIENSSFDDINEVA